MRVAFISDIHGNAHALDAVLDDIRSKSVDKIVVLGDIAYRGPEPKRAIELIRNLNTTVIKGNADEWVTRGIKKGEVPDEALALMTKEREWTVSQLDQEDLDYLSNLPEETRFDMEGVRVHAFHATPTSLFDVVLPNTDDETIKTKLMTEKDADLYLYGHIHTAYVRPINGKTIINLGSVGLPFDGHAKASYALVTITEGYASTSIEKVSYDLQKTIAMYDEVNYPNAKMMQNIVRNGSL